jgi:hypothetical protein
VLPWALLVVGSLAANVAVAEPTVAGRVIVAWPSFALIGAYELLMREVRRGAAGHGQPPRAKPVPRLSGWEGDVGAVPRLRRPASDPARGERRAGGVAGRDLQRQAWLWAQANRAGDGSLPSGREIAHRYGRHERWGRQIKRAGAAGQLPDGRSSSGFAASVRAGACRVDSGNRDCENVIMSEKNCYWRTISFAPAPRGLELRRLDADGDRSPLTVPVVGWLTQEQVYDNGERVGVAAVRVITGILRPFSDDAAAVDQESDDGWSATEVVPADDYGWHACWRRTDGS